MAQSFYFSSLKMDKAPVFRRVLRTIHHRGRRGAQGSGLEDFFRCNDSVAVDCDRIFYVQRVATGIRYHHWNVLGPGYAKYQFVSSLQAFNRQIQAAELIFTIWISACDVTDQVRLELAKTGTERVVEPGKIVVVANAVGQIDVDRGR